MHGIPCTFDAFLTHASRPIARVSFDRTNYARSIEQLCVRDQRLSYTLHYDVDRYIIHFDKSKIWKRVNLSNESSANHSRFETQFSLFQTLFEKFERNSVSNILKRFYRDDFSLSISAPQKITRTSLPLSFQSP